MEEDNLLLIIVSIDDFNVINESSANKVKERRKSFAASVLKLFFNYYVIFFIEFHMLFLCIPF